MASLNVWSLGPYYEISQATLAASPGDSIVVLGAKSGGALYDPAIVLDENLTINALVDVGLIQLSMATGIVQLNAEGSSAFFITGNASNNIISTGDRDDFISGEGGNDTLNGGDGDDIAAYILSPAGVRINLAYGDGSDGYGSTDTLISIEALIGSQFNDVLSGDSKDNFFLGLHGNDIIHGGGGIDTVSYEDIGAGGGAVTVNLSTGVATDGLGGTDTLTQIERVIGTQFGDTLTGDVNSNTFLPEAGNDVVNGGGGTDYVSYETALTGVTVNLLSQTASDGLGGTDTLTSIEGVIGSAFGDTIVGDAEDNFFSGEAGSDILNGSGGSDTVSYASSTSRVTVDLGLGTASDGLGGTDALTSIENVFGSSFDDTLMGSSAANLFVGGAGDDLLSGGNGDDTAVYELAANNYTVTYFASTNTYTVVAHAGDEGTDTLSSIEYLSFGENATVFDIDSIAVLPPVSEGVFVGDGNNNNFAPGDGDDTIDGRGGVDTVSYATSTSGITANLGTGVVDDGMGGTDTLTSVEGVIGSAFGDTLTGSAGDDFFQPGGGVNTIFGGGGTDILSYADAGSSVLFDLKNGHIRHSYVNHDRMFDVEIFVGGFYDDGFIDGPGSQTYDGGQGADGVAFGLDLNAPGIRVDLRTGLVEHQSGDVDTLINIEGVSGTRSNDYVIAVEEGYSSISGHGGNDKISFAFFSKSVEFHTYPGQLILDGQVVTRITGFETVEGSNFDDVFTGSGRLTPMTFIGRGGDDTISTTQNVVPIGKVVASYEVDPSSVTVNLATGVALDGFGGTDTLIGVTDVVGSDHDDLLLGSDVDNTFVGRGGDDTIDGADGTDTAIYALSADQYTVTYDAGSGDYTVTALSGDEGTDTLRNIEFLSFNGGATDVAIADAVAQPQLSSDFDGDGDDDVVFSFVSDTNAMINHADGSGGSWIGYAGRTLLDTGDFDGDGDTDLLFQLADGNKLIFNVGQGGTWLGSSDRAAKAVGDFDGDGDDDVVFEFADGNKLIANVGEGNTWLGLNNRSLIATGDFDGDGDDDFLFEFADGNKLISRLGEANIWVGASDRTAKGVGDFDGDGDDDILFEFANGDKLIFNAGVGNTWLGNSDRSIEAVGDFDGDGDDDILFEFADGNKIIANVGSASTWLGQTNRSAMAVGDFDGDGDDDILMELADGNHLIVHVGTGNQWLGFPDRDAIGSDVTGLGTSIEVA